MPKLKAPKYSVDRYSRFVRGLFRDAAPNQEHIVDAIVAAVRSRRKAPKGFTVDRLNGYSYFVLVTPLRFSVLTCALVMDRVIAMTEESFVVARRAVRKVDLRQLPGGLV